MKELLEILKNKSLNLKDLNFKDLNLKDLNAEQISELYKVICGLNPTEEMSYESVKNFLAKKIQIIKDLNEMYCYLRNFLGPFCLREEETIFGTRKIKYFYDLQGYVRNVEVENVFDEFKIINSYRELKDKKDKYEELYKELKDKFEEETL